MGKSEPLKSPLKAFNVPIVSWRPNEEQFKRFQNESRITYVYSGGVQIKGREWYLFRAYDAKEELLGEFFLPPKYYPLWRRLIYGALLQEKMYAGWIRRTARLKGRRLTASQQEEVNLRNTAGVRMVQYLMYRRVVLEELFKLRFDNDEPVIHSLVEFGIRESRDWLFETFETAKQQGAIYLRLDPSAATNKTQFGEC
jgi:hypothetical protein